MKEVDCRKCGNCTGSACAIYGNDANSAVFSCAKDNFINYKQFKHTLTNEILLSLHPQYWELIKSGKKTIEIRKTKPQKVRPLFRVFVYVTGGVGVVGCFDCDMVIQTTPERLAIGIYGESCLTEAELTEYAAGKPLFAWHVAPGSVFEYESPIELERVIGSKTPPQSWIYLRG